MSEGAWITIGITILGVFGTAITALIKRPGPEKPEPKTEAVCQHHSGIKSDYRALHESQVRLEDGQKDIWTAVEGIRSDVGEIKTMMQFRSNGGSG